MNHMGMNNPGIEVTVLYYRLSARKRSAGEKNKNIKKKNNLLAVRQYAGTVLSALPDSDALPRESEESACIAAYYAGSKQVG